MDRIPERLRFNFERETSVALGGSTGSDTTSDHIMLIPSDDPLIDLRLNHEGVRTDVYADGGALKVPTQRGKLGRLRLVPEMHDPFGPSIDWAYRCYEVLRPADDRVFRKYLYLFNVLVALEWQPDEAYLEQLKTAFRRASDFLFDVTDGWMAFGQVVFGGPELMDSADIQIMASTRLHPRSWVGGMHPQKEYANDEKYMPIRLGRGVWNDNRCGIIPWVEPEGYRIIIHEWGHHALKLTDEYLEIRQLLLSANAGLLQAGSQALVAAPPTAVVMLKVATTTDSVMATTEGTSELVSKQWSKVSELFPSIPDRLDIDVREGPGHLPAALPRFRRIEAPKSAEKKAAQQFFFPPWRTIGTALNRLLLPDDIRLDHCWVYVSRGIRNGGLKSARLLSQGTLEARTDIAPFPLLGAKAGDAVILIGEQYDQDPVVLRADIDTTGDMNWSNASPSICPTIDIIPDSVAPNEPRASVRVRLNYVDTATPTDLPDQISIFPLGQSLDYEVQLLKGPYHRDWISASQDLPTLDGHVLVRWKDGRQIITPFSQGGDGPNSNQPFPANPMNAGSSDGQALLFMYKEAGDDAPRDIKVVTALAHGLNSMPANWHGCSYAFSIASNQPLPRQFSPTLIMYYDANGVPNQGQDNSGDLRICRWVAAKGWVALPTFVPAGFRFVVAPLNRESGGALIDPAAPHPRVEYYKVCWVPRGA